MRSAPDANGIDAERICFRVTTPLDYQKQHEKGRILTRFYLPVLSCISSKLALNLLFFR
jgi:hypothetical protein